VKIFLIMWLFFISVIASASSDSLQIVAHDQSRTLSKSELLSRPDLEQVSINNDRAYPNKIMHHQAIPLCKLLAPFHVKKQDWIELISKDDFHVYVPAIKIMDCSKNASTAMLAIEPKTKWPAIANHHGETAGPYEVIWLHPERSNVPNEYWAWSLVAIKVTGKLDDKDVLPLPKTTNPALINGYTTYISQCEACHRMNRIGKSSIGPDLNCPKNPLEYYPDIAVLKKFIRDPQSVLALPKRRMAGVDSKSLSDEDLNNLIQFFAYMKTEKRC